MQPAGPAPIMATDFMGDIGTRYLEILISRLNDEVNGLLMSNTRSEPTGAIQRPIIPKVPDLVHVSNKVAGTFFFLNG